MTEVVFFGFGGVLLLLLFLIIGQRNKMKFKKSAQLTGHNAGIYALCWGFEDDHFFSAGGDGWIVRWDFNNPDLGKLMAKVDVQIFSMCLLKREKTIVVGNMNGGVHWINMDSPDDTKGVQAHEKGVFDIVAHGDYVFTVGGGEDLFDGHEKVALQSKRFIYPINH